MVQFKFRKLFHLLFNLPFISQGLELFQNPEKSEFKMPDARQITVEKNAVTKVYLND